MKDLYKQMANHKEATLLIQNYDFSSFSDWYRSNSQILNNSELEESSLINKEFERDYTFLDTLIKSVEYLQINLNKAKSIYEN